MYTILKIYHIKLLLSQLVAKSGPVMSKTGVGAVMGAFGQCLELINFFIDYLVNQSWKKIKSWFGKHC